MEYGNVLNSAVVKINQIQVLTQCLVILYIGFGANQLVVKYESHELFVQLSSFLSWKKEIPQLVPLFSDNYHKARKQLITLMSLGRNRSVCVSVCLSVYSSLYKCPKGQLMESCLNQTL